MHRASCSCRRRTACPAVISNQMLMQDYVWHAGHRRHHRHADSARADAAQHPAWGPPCSACAARALTRPACLLWCAAWQTLDFLRRCRATVCFAPQTTSAQQLSSCCAHTVWATTQHMSDCLRQQHWSHIAGFDIVVFVQVSSSASSCCSSSSWRRCGTKRARPPTTRPASLAPRSHCSCLRLAPFLAAASTLRAPSALPSCAATSSTCGSSWWLLSAVRHSSHHSSDHSPDHSDHSSDRLAHFHARHATSQATSLQHNAAAD